MKNLWSIIFLVVGVFLFNFSFAFKSEPASTGWAIAAGLCVLAAGLPQIGRRESVRRSQKVNDDDCLTLRDKMIIGKAVKKAQETQV